jgi:hypothetical protein
MDATTRAKEVVDLLERNVPEFERAGQGSLSQGRPNQGEGGPEPGPEEQFEAEVRVDGEELHLAPFVQDFVSRTVLGMLSSLKGYKPGIEFKIEIRRF